MLHCCLLTYSFFLKLCCFGSGDNEKLKLPIRTVLEKQGLKNNSVLPEIRELFPNLEIFEVQKKIILKIFEEYSDHKKTEVF